VKGSTRQIDRRLFVIAESRQLEGEQPHLSSGSQKRTPLVENAAHELQIGPALDVAR
jgi:hypothetical protein